MKNLTSFAFVSVLIWSGCREIPPDISFSCDTERVVLVEEFTGVKCVNCPAGTEKLVELSGIHGDKLIVVGVHAGFFSVPYDDSPEDFTTADGQAIDAWAGPATGWPAAMVNRRQFAGESERVLGLNSWAGHISSERCEDPLVSVNVSATYNSDTRQVSISVNGSGLGNAVINEKLGLSVLITEDSIVAPQAKEGVGKVPDYIHRHVLRDIITDYKGKDIHNSGTVGSYQESFSYTLPAHWNADKCHVIAFVHHKTGSNLAILQAAETHW